MSTQTKHRSPVWAALVIVCSLTMSFGSTALAATSTTAGNALPSQDYGDATNGVAVDQDANPIVGKRLQDPIPRDSDDAPLADGLGFFNADGSLAGQDRLDDADLTDDASGPDIPLDETLVDGEGLGASVDSDPPLTDSQGLDGMRVQIGGNIDVNLKLVGAKIVQFDPDDTDDEFVEYLFAEKVLDIYDPASFKLIGVSSLEVASARQVFRDEQNPKALIVGFAPGIDPTDFALAAVEPGAVASIKGETNPGDSEVLIGSKVKDSFSTAIPKLVQVKIEPSLERILYQFDQKLDESYVNEKGFGFYTFEGELHYPSKITSINDKQVIAKFDENSGDQVEEAVRAVVFGGAVRDKSGLPNPTGSKGGFTTAPDVVKVYNGPTRTQFDFAFDQDVTSPTPKDFVVYTRLGKPYPAADARLIAPGIVRVIVPQVREFDDEVVFGSIAAGAVTGDSGFGTLSTAGGLVLANKKLDDIGFVSGPELINVQVNAKESMVKFFFDEKVDDDQFADPSLFSLITVSGAVQPGRSFVDADDKWIVITFPPSAIKAAQTAMIAANAVRDFEGNGNPPSIYK